MPKLTFDEALQRINEQRTINADEIRADALRRVVWVAEWHIPGCLSESVGFSTTKQDAIADALSMMGDNPPRGARADLQRYGRTDRVSPGAYVSMAITTVRRTTLGGLL